MKHCAVLAASAFLMSAANQFAAGESAAGHAGVAPGQPDCGEIVGATNGVAGKSAGALDIAGIEKTVTLTAEQKDAMAKIIAARDKAIKDFQAKNADLLKARMQAMTDALKSGDQAAMAAAQKGYQEAYAGTSRIFRQAQIDLENVLTPEQRAKRQEEWASRMIKTITEPVVLTPEQLAQIKAVLAKRNTGDAEPWSGGQWYESVQGILTPEQKAVITKHRALEYVKAVFARAKLTPDQMKLVEAAYEGISRDSTLNSEGVMKKLADGARNLLTEEQREAMKRKGLKEITPGSASGNPLNRAVVPPK